MVTDIKGALDSSCVRDTAYCKQLVFCIDCDFACQRQQHLDMV